MDKKTIENSSTDVSRRKFLGGAGLAIVGSSLIGTGLPLSFGGNTAKANTALGDEIIPAPLEMKPVVLAPQGSIDPAEHSLADTLFWSDIMMEHAMFFVMLMPGAELAQVRAQAQTFQLQFTNHLASMKATRFDKATYVALNKKTIALVTPFLEFKERMLALQLDGKVRTLVWPLFFAHTAREARRFIHRLELYNTGKAVFERKEVVEFWTTTMGEHAQFISHLLDPQETQLIQKADATAEAFLNTLRLQPQSYQLLLQAGEEIIDFKTAAEKGIETGDIKSIIHPALADHVRREAVKYVDELKRT